jgi:plastocyanin
MTSARAIRITGLTALLLIASIIGSRGVAMAGGGGCYSQVISDERGTTVTMTGSCFEPTVLRVEAGESVTWTNEDSAPHTVSGVNGVWGSYDQFEQGASVTEQFDEPGVYPYWCALHPSMLGTVVVEDGGGATVAATGGDGSGVGPGALGAVAGVMLTSIGMVAWRRRPSLMSRSG